MTSKDKLIEFLKSASIEYEVATYSISDETQIELEYTIYFFDKEGNYLRQENY